MTIVPDQNDVVLDRDDLSSVHDGNIKFNTIVDSQKTRYANARSKYCKIDIIFSIIKQIESADPPGRFLKRANHIGVGEAWISLDKDEVFSVISQCLKDKIETDRNEKSNSPLQTTPTINPAPDLQDGSEKSINLEKGPDNSVISPQPYNNSVKGSKSFLTLTEWISRAIDTVDVSSVANDSHFSVTYGADVSSWPFLIKTFVAITTDAYIQPALRIAHSLVDQLVKARDESKLMSEQRTVEDSPRLPPTKYDWLDRVVVHIRPGSINDDAIDNLEPISLSTQNDRSSTPNELHKFLISVQCGSSQKSMGGKTASDNTDALNALLIRPDAISARMQLCEEDNNDGIFLALDEEQQIYCLGRVFYSLFSGGEVPNVSCNRHLQKTIDFKKGLVLSNDLPNDSAKYCRESIGQVGDLTDPYKSRKQDKAMGSVESLKIRGVPISLCILIHDMLDCANGDVRGDESFTCVMDVREELKRMIEKPTKFLRGKIPLTGLELDDTIWGQESEFFLLQDCYRRSLSQGPNAAIIRGPSGIGKTVLANRFAEYLATNGGLFLSGKFDQLQQAAPFTAITQAFNEYCSEIVADGESNHAITVASSIHSALGKDACYLIDVIPNLSLILGDTGTTDTNRNCVDAEKRLQFLLCVFVDTISRSLEAPLTLFLDDLQWADRSSIELIRYLLTSRSSSFFFLGSCRDDEVGQNHPILNMIQDVRNFGVKVEIVEMSLMDEATANEAVSDLLCLSPRLTWPLSEIVHRKTKGNPLFFFRLLKTLNNEGSLRFCLSSRRWEWDEEKIQSMKIPDDVAEFFSNAISKLSHEVRTAICALSCFGACANASVVNVLEAELGFDFHTPLGLAVKQGFLDEVDGCYHFTHDRIQEAAYNAMAPDGRLLLHSQYGIALCCEIIKKGLDDAMIFVAVDQINRAGPAVISDVEQGTLMAKMNLRAGNKAMAMSNFPSALNFIEFGISFLWNDHWLTNYDLSLELFDNAVTCAYSVRDRNKVYALSEKILANARTFEATLNCHYVKMCALCDESMLEEAIKKGVEVLSQLDVKLDLSVEFSHCDNISLFENVRSIMCDLSDDYLVGYVAMSDPLKVMAMKFLNRLLLSTAMSRPLLFPRVCAEAATLSLAQGMTPLSAVTFSYVGGILGTVGNIQEGCRLARFAKKLIGRFGSKEVAGEVIATTTQIISYAEPLQATIEFHLEGRDVAMETGDTRSASLNLLAYTICLSWSGAKLDLVITKYNELFRFMEQHHHLDLMIITKPFYELISKLSGVSGIGVLLSPSHDVEYLIEKNLFAAKTYYFIDMYASFILRDYDSMKTSAETFFSYHSLRPLVMHHSDVIEKYIGGLVSFWIYRETKDPRWFDRGNHAKNELKKLATHSEWNFAQKYYLLEAEEQYCNQLLESAKLNYERAIRSSNEHKFINDEALANDLAANFYWKIRRLSTSLEFLTRAQEKYYEWGALTKSKQINDVIQDINQNTTL